MVNFDKATHTYTNEEGKELISVTKLLAKHGLAPDLSFVDTKVLQDSAERGTVIHELLEDYLITGEIAPVDEVASLAKWAKGHKVNLISIERPLANDIVAGTYDCLIEVDDRLTLIDFKTTSAKHVHTWRWQLSLYKRLIWDEYMLLPTRLDVFWFDRNGALEIVPIEPISDREIDRLLDCERNGEFYKEYDVKEVGLLASNELLAKAEQIEKALTLLNKQKKEFEEQYALVKDALLTAMEQSGTKKFSTDNIAVTYVAPSQSVGFDKDAFKKDNPDLYSKYNTKVTERKAYVKIALL